MADVVETHQLMAMAGKYSPLFTKVSYMLGGDRRISEPSTVSWSFAKVPNSQLKLSRDQFKSSRSVLNDLTPLVSVSTVLWKH